MDEDDADYMQGSDEEVCLIHPPHEKSTNLRQWLKGLWLRVLGR